MVGVFVDGYLLQRVDITPATVNRYTPLCRRIVTHTALVAKAIEKGLYNDNYINKIIEQEDEERNF